MQTQTPAAREPDRSIGEGAVDQAARTADVPGHIPTEAEIIDELRKQIADAEGRVTATQEEARRQAERAAAADSARADAEARARQADTRRQEVEHVSERTVAQTQLDSLTGTLESSKGHMVALKTQLKDAMESGDFAKVADVQAEMSLLGGKIVTLETGKAALDERIKAEPTGRAATGDPGPAELTAVERRENFIRSQPSLIQSWLRGEKGERFFNDPSFQSQVVAAAKEAGQVFNVQSQQYLDMIEERVGLRQPSATPPANNQNNQTGTGGRDASGDGRMVAAPAGGANGGSYRTQPGGGDNQVSLSREEREMAARSGVSEAEWARHKKALLEDGLIGPAANLRR